MRRSIAMLMFLAIAMCGCATFGPGTKSLNDAKITGYGMAEWFKGIHAYTKQLYDAASPADKPALEKKLNPLVNKMQKYIVLYCDGVILWETSGTRPFDLDKTYREILRLYDDIVAAGGKEVSR